LSLLPCDRPMSSSVFSRLDMELVTFFKGYAS
jgi:hypothetical protein